MHINDAMGQFGVRGTRAAARSALPDAPVIEDLQPAFRARTAAALHRLADRIGRVDAPGGRAWHLSQG